MNPRKDLEMFLYNSFKKWLCVADQNCTKKPLVRKKDNQQQTKAIFLGIGKFRLDVFFTKIAWVGLFLRSDHFSWGDLLMNCLIKEKKNFDFGENFSVHRNRETLLAIFSPLVKPLGQISSAIMIQLFNFETNEYVAYIYVFNTSDYQMVSSY